MRIMKKLTVPILLVVILTLVVLSRGYVDSGSGEVKSEKLQPILTPVPTQVLSERNGDGEVNLDGQNFVYVIEKNILPGKLKLIPNYGQKEFTRETSLDQSCRSLINGGFYGTSNEPIGWLVIDGKVISSDKSSSLFNGFVAVTADDKLSVGVSKPNGDIRYGLQTGPVLINSGRVQILQMERDKNARRGVILSSRDGQATFLMVFAKLSDQLGPTLTELPELVYLISKQEGIDPDYAVNLDGGSASVFWRKDVYLEETVPVGSWWCAEN